MRSDRSSRQLATTDCVSASNSSASRSLRPRDLGRRPPAKVRPLLESIEGTPADDWPPSPPLQSLSIETLPEAAAPPCSSAWPAAATGRPASSRCLARRRWCSILLVEPVNAACRWAAATACLAPKSPQLAVTAELACAVRPEGKDAIAIVPGETGGPGTIRWKYRISVLALDAPPCEQR